MGVIYLPPGNPQNLKLLGFKWGGGGLGGSETKARWGMLYLTKESFTRQLTIQPLNVGYANRPKKAKNEAGDIAFFPIYTCLALI